MKYHHKRLKEMAAFAIPPVVTFDRKKIDELIRRIQEQDPTAKEKVKKIYEKVKSIITAQSKNGAQFPIDELIREFYLEYNNRNISYGLTVMPSSFNVMEAYFEFFPRINVFKIREERDHLLSFIEFLDYVTSGESENIIDAIEYLQENVIYSYNFINDPGEITFSVDEGGEYGVGGVSLIRHGTEISILLLAGEKADISMETEKLKDLPESSVPGKEFIVPDKDKKREAVPLLGHKNFWKVIVLTRIDLENMTQNVRYFMRDIGNGYLTLTDDSEVFVKPTGEFISPDYEKCAKEIADEIKKYSALFEICKTAIYLPLYFEYYGDIVTEERHKTLLGEERHKNALKVKNKLITAHERVFYRRVSVLDREIGRQPDMTMYHAPEFKMETSGFWRRLPMEHIGADKLGRTIHGKTWVEKRLTWIDDDSPVLNIKKYKNVEKTFSDPNRGYIYVLRSAAHEKDIFKVGLTTRLSEVRSNELSRNTGSPDKFLVVQEWEVSDCKVAEKLIHERLEKYRINPKREFFKAPYE